MITRLRQGQIRHLRLPRLGLLLVQQLNWWTVAMRLRQEDLVEHDDFVKNLPSCSNQISEICTYQDEKGQKIKQAHFKALLSF